LCAAIITDMGGDDTITTAQRALAEQSALLIVLNNDYGTRWLLGELPEHERAGWMSSINVMRRVLESVGLKRVAKEVNFADYLRRAAPDEIVEAMPAEPSPDDNAENIDGE